MSKITSKKAIDVLERLIKELDRKEPPSLIDQDRVAALRKAVETLEHYPKYKTVDE